MGLRKYGTSDSQEILRDDEEEAERKEAAKHWTEEDREQLEQENQEADAG